MAAKFLYSRFNLAGHYGFVTGHMAKLLVQSDISGLAICARRADRLQSLKSELDRISPSTEVNKTKIIPIEMDVCNFESVLSAFEIAQCKFGSPVDVIINNAGISIQSPFLEISLENHDKLMMTNLRGPWIVAQEGAKRLVERNQPGSIINIASILGVRTGQQLSSYAVSKAGLIHMTKSLALELARYHIRVNAICPGYIKTEMNEEFFESEAGEKFLKKSTLSRRLGQPEELDGAVLLLASQAGSFVNGATIAVDGGHLCTSL